MEFHFINHRKRKKYDKKEEVGRARPSFIDPDFEFGICLSLFPFFMSQSSVAAAV